MKIGHHTDKSGVKYPNIQITKGMAGWFAVMVHWCPDLGGFPEPWDSGLGRYETQAEAIVEGRGWAEAEEMPFIEPEPDTTKRDPRSVIDQMKEIIPDLQVVNVEDLR